MSCEGRNLGHHVFGETVTFDKYQSRARKLQKMWSYHCEHLLSAVTCYQCVTEKLRNKQLIQESSIILSQLLDEPLLGRYRWMSSGRTLPTCHLSDSSLYYRDGTVFVSLLLEVWVDYEIQRVKTAPSQLSHLNKRIWRRKWSLGSTLSNQKPLHWIMHSP